MPGLDELGRGRISSRRAATVAILLVAATVSGCKACADRSDGMQAPRLGSVTVKPVPDLVVRGARISIDSRAVEERVRPLLEGAAVFASPEAKRPTAHVTLQAELIDATEAKDPTIGVRLRLRITIRPSQTSSGRFAEDVEAMGETRLLTDEATMGSAFQRLLERTAEDLVKAYLARQKLWLAPASELDLALRSGDSDVRVEALRIIAARKLSGRSETLLALLADEDENVRDAALGAVVALHEQRAVKVLAESRSMRDTREMKKIIHAIAALGGGEARDYLAFVAQNHDDAEVREMAKQALDKTAPKGPSQQSTR